MLIDPKSITGLTADSRAVKRGYLFAAIKGEHVDGSEYIDQAIANGATAILTDTHPSLPDHVTLIKVDNVRKALSQIASDFYLHRPENIVAVTGTNGKSSIVTFLEQIWKAEGLSAASIGTLSGGLTSPDPISLHQNLSELAEQGVTHLAIEASSHGLDQYRADGVAIKAAGFTNLSHDHLDYHADMDEYLNAKLRLFTEILPSDGVAVLNADIPEFEELKSKSQGRVISYGYGGEDIKIIAVTPTENGQKAALEIFGEPYTVEINLIGDFQLSNILCALGLSFLNTKPNRIVIESKIKTLETVKSAKGRLQPVLGHPAGAAIYIDYAHTPDALRSVLNTARSHAKGAVFCVFGCGGDRDKSKRPVMGRIASQLADQVILTDDNPRSENSVDIISEILAGVPKNMHNENVIKMSDRSAAIHYSIKQLTKDDILVIAGKGHEVGQILESGIIPFDDTEEAEKAIAAL